MTDFTIAERLRTAHTKRWQIVRVAREQTLAEHMYLVWVLTRAFARAANFSYSDCGLAESWALEHDVPEVITGDLATPVKRALREAVPHDDPIRRIELALSDSYRELHAKTKDRAWVYDLVKLADVFEAVLFLHTEGMGPHAKRVEADLWADFHERLGKCAVDWKHMNFNWINIYDIANDLYNDKE